MVGVKNQLHVTFCYSNKLDAGCIFIKKIMTLIIIFFQIFGKVGTLQTRSWKLREESGDLPVEMLCNKCQYFSSDLHSTRASHIMLLELIIDR